MAFTPLDAKTALVVIYLQHGVIARPTAHSAREAVKKGERHGSTASHGYFRGWAKPGHPGRSSTCSTRPTHERGRRADCTRVKGPRCPHKLGYSILSPQSAYH